MSDYAVQRERMVRDLIAARGVRDERVLAALRKTPRHLFVKAITRCRSVRRRRSPNPTSWRG